MISSDKKTKNPKPSSIDKAFSFLHRGDVRVDQVLFTTLFAAPPVSTPSRWIE